MVRFHIRVNNGDDNVTHKYYFVHKQWETLDEKEQEKQWDSAVKELNDIYQRYGRFATQQGVISFFNEHKFELTVL